MAVKVKPTKGSKHYTEDGTHHLSALSEDKLEHVRDMLTNGMPINYIASVIQDEWGMLTDASEQTLVRLLRKYKAGNITPTDIAERINPHTVVNAVRQVKQHLNTLEVYSEMVELQRTRIHMGMAKERETNELSRITDEAMATMNSLLKNYSEIAIKVGLLQRMMDGDDRSGPNYEPENLAQALGDRVVRQEMVKCLDGMLSELEALPPPKDYDE